MPTWNRRPFIRAAIQSFLDQTYENRELVIVDDGDERVLDLIPADPRIRYLQGPGRLSTGRKRNMCCDISAGEIICHFDDDDFSMPTRIADQVERLLRTGKPITGYGTMLFWDRTTRQAKRYRPSVTGYVCGTSLAYLRSYWEVKPFKHIPEAEDNAFVYQALRQIASADGSEQLVARIHGCHQTSTKRGISEVVPESLIPVAFWNNEKLIS